MIKQRLIALLLCFCMIPSFVVFSGARDDSEYDTDFVANHLRIKVNVYDQDEAVAGNGNVPVPNVDIGINRYVAQQMQYFGNLTSCPGIITLTSDANGVAYADIPFTVVAKSGGDEVAYLNNIQDGAHAIHQRYYAGGNSVWYDLSVLSSGYRQDEISGFMRNCIGYANASPDPKTTNSTGAAYDDFHFNGQITLQNTYNFSDDPSGTGPYGGGAFIEYNLYVKANTVTVTYENDGNIKDFEQTDYPSVTDKAGMIVSAPSKTPAHNTNSDIEFVGWKNKDTGELFDFSQPVTADVTLVPMWKNTKIAGYVHLDSFLWDHDGYNGTYQTGQTTTTVNKLTYVVEYYDQAVATTSQWNTLCEVEVDENGQADFVITPEMLATLKAFKEQIEKEPPAANGEPHYVAIDIGPSKTDRGWHEANERPLAYAWDWVKYDYSQDHGAGLTGVRMMWVNADQNPLYDLNRDNNDWAIDSDKAQGKTNSAMVGNVMYATNPNHVMWLTDSMLNDGFEIYWKCWVAPSTTVNFDLNGGTGTGDYSEQMMKPINSLQEERPDFLVKHPGGEVTRGNDVFVGWYKVINDETGATESIPWDFANRIVTESMTLKALYTDKLYTVRFETENNGTQEAKLKVGDTPAWAGEDPTPTKSADNIYTYEFEKWEETTGASKDSDYLFKDKYDMDHTARTIYDNLADTNPVAVTSSFADLTVYTAKFKATPIQYTLKYDLNGGTGTFADQTYNAVDGVTIYNAEPSKEGYTFTGWTLKETDGDWVDKTYSKSEKVTGKYGNTTLIANYVADEVTINYVAVPAAGGTLSISSETVKASQTPQGSAATANPGYSFGGWYTDADCKNAVTADDGTVTENKFVPAENKEATYYAKFVENQVTIKYVAVTTDGGSVSLGQEVIGAVNGMPLGSTATAKDGYQFVGWYSDENCTMNLSNDAKYTPGKAPDGLYKEATYYAKFAKVLSSLTITKAGADTSFDADQTFIFNVKGTSSSGEAIDMDVTITGNGSVTISDLPAGTYTVTEKTDWSWRYTQKEVSGLTDGKVTVGANGGEVTFTNELTKENWLSGNAVAVNTWSEGTVSSNN